jgi:uncharacterized protein (DUF433 family)
MTEPQRYDIASITVITRMDDGRVFVHELDGRTADLTMDARYPNPEPEFEPFSGYRLPIPRSPHRAEFTIAATARFTPRQIEGLPPYDGELGVVFRMHADPTPAALRSLAGIPNESIADRPHVKVDPAQSWGRPAVKGVSCEAIAGLIIAGEELAAVAEDYGLTRADVLVACWYLGLMGTRQYRRRWKAWAEDAGQHMWAASAATYDEIPDPPVEART